MRTLHRNLSLFIVLSALFLGVTGTIIETIDLYSLGNHLPENNAEMLAMREDGYGPEGFAVVEPSDYSAPAFAADTDYDALLSRLVTAAHSQLGATDYNSVTLRSLGASIVGVAQTQTTRVQLNYSQDHITVDAVSGSLERPKAVRNDVKSLHRMTAFRQNWLLFINPIVGIAVGVLIVTGLWMYARVYRARRRAGLLKWFWRAGGWWRTLHRWISLASSTILLVMTLSGTWLAYESLVFGYYLTAQQSVPSSPNSVRKTPLSTILESELAERLHASLAILRQRVGSPSIKAIQIRTFGGMPQAAFVLSEEESVQQVVYDTRDGREVSETEPGYPVTGFPFGWQAHQYAKQIHRGSLFGLTGRWMGLLGGLSMIFLSLSGICIYFDMWRKRRGSGRTPFFWT